MKIFKENDLVSFNSDGKVQLGYVVLNDSEQQKSMVETTTDVFVWIDDNDLTLESRMPS